MQCLTLGPLNSVTDVRRHNTNITWKPPFSQDLTNFEPDIIYCLTVDLFNCSMTVPWFRQCGIEVPYYVVNSFHNNDLLKIEVTPMSNGGGVNGTTLTVQGNHALLEYQMLYLTSTLCVSLIDIIVYLDLFLITRVHDML